ncbi:Protein kinase domain-containing protein [Aphelenchoides bicaudatus]|nr:Protein kinase domain-containing protein [Aphelenchoides bicaudatus]
MGDTELIQFKPGKIVSGRWKIAEKLGSGGCGVVYEVESNNIEDGGVLKLEADVLQKLSNRKKCIRLLHSGKRKKYSFIVVTLCGPDLMCLKRMRGQNDNKRENDYFSETSIMRIGVHALYAIKQLHEIGFVHRDVKPGNTVIGLYGRDARTIFMIDYGMVRSFVVKDEKTNKYVLRKPRRKVLLRGTLRYCSTNVHRRMEQGRCDDVWSLLYMLVELYVGLPWSGIKEEKPLQKMKETVSDEKLFENCPVEFGKISQHLRKLKYEDRPDYKYVYDCLMEGVRRLKTNFSKPYDWEDAKELEKSADTALSITEGRKSNQGSIITGTTGIQTLSDNKSSCFRRKRLRFIMSNPNNALKNALKKGRVAERFRALMLARSEGAECTFSVLSNDLVTDLREYQVPTADFLDFIDDVSKQLRTEAGLTDKKQVYPSVSSTTNSNSGNASPTNSTKLNNSRIRSSRVHGNCSGCGTSGNLIENTGRCRECSAGSSNSASHGNETPTGNRVHCSGCAKRLSSKRETFGICLYCDNTSKKLPHPSAREQQKAENLE